MTTRKNSKSQQQQGLIIGAVVALVVVVALIAVIVLSQSAAEGSGIAYTEGELENNVQMYRTDDGGHVIGNPDAPITIVTFEDFFCPACQQYKPVVNEVLQELVLTGDAQLEFRYLQTQREPSPYSMQLAECAGELVDGGFWVAHDWIFAEASAGGVTTSDLSQGLAEEVGISQAELIECSSDAEQGSIDTQLARANGISSTPTVRVRYGDGPLQVIPGAPQGGGVPYETIESTVASAPVQ